MITVPIYSGHGRTAEYYSEHCLPMGLYVCVCSWAYPRDRMFKHVYQIFCVYCLCPGLFLCWWHCNTLCSSACFPIMGHMTQVIQLCCKFSDSPGAARICILKLTYQGSNGPGAESFVYNCPVFEASNCTLYILSLCLTCNL